MQTEYTLKRRFEWHGRTVAWDHFGAGPALVMCHGTPWSSALWRSYAEALRADASISAGSCGSASSTQSIERVSFVTSSGSIAGNMPTRS